MMQTENNRDENNLSGANAPALSGRIDNSSHYLDLRVYYEDTDFSGIVYHANYLRFFERGRTDFLRLCGITQSALFDGGEKLALVVRSMNIDFLKPALMDDLVSVRTSIRTIGGASLMMEQELWRSDTLLVRASVKIAALKNEKAARFPALIRQVFNNYISTDQK